MMNERQKSIVTLLLALCVHAHADPRPAAGTGTPAQPIETHEGARVIAASNPSLAAREAEAREALKPMLQEIPGMSIAVTQNGVLIWSEGMGLSQLMPPAPVSVDSVFRYYSLSKALTGIAAKQLVEAGKLDLNKPVTHYLPTLPLTYAAVTPGQLLAHTAGVRHYKNGEWLSVSRAQCAQPSEAFGAFIDDPLLFKPGAGYQYSSFGYVLLSAVLESAGKQAFADYMQDRVFRPAGVGSITMDNRGPRSGRESGTFQTAGTGKFSLAPAVNNSGKFGAGGFNGTAADLALVFARLLEGKLGVDAGFLRQNFPVVAAQNGIETRADFGLFQVRVPTTGEVAFIHNGSGVGGSACLAILPASDLVVVVLGNAETTKLRSSAINIAKIFTMP